LEAAVVVIHSDEKFPAPNARCVPVANRRQEKLKTSEATRAEALDGCITKSQKAHTVRKTMHVNCAKCAFRRGGE
jgi:hypothetical protein